MTAISPRRLRRAVALSVACSATLITLSAAPQAGAMEIGVQDTSVFVFQNYYNRVAALDKSTAFGANTMFYNLDWATAEREYKRAIELNPNYEITYEVYSYLLLSMGRTDEGIKMTQRSLEVAPLSTLIADDLAYAYYLARRYDEAIRTCQKSLELDPNHFGGPLNLGVVYEAKGMHDEAIKQFEKAIAIGGRTSGVLALLAHAYATSGRQAEAQKILAELNEVSKQAYVSSYDLAILYVGLGDKDRALEQLNKSYEDRAGFIIYLNVEPLFDPLRADPRFSELVRKMKFQS